MVKKITLRISGMHCASCAMSIDGELEDTEGIKESNTNYAKSTTEVQFDTEKITEKEIVGIIKKVGYEARVEE